jgi:hypothetical protein
MAGLSYLSKAGLNRIWYGISLFFCNFKIVRIQTNYLKVFKTRTKVPCLVYIETVSKEDSESQNPEWEKDILYQQIFHKIKMAKELNLSKNGNVRGFIFLVNFV